jgi:PDZ domain-containing protein
VFLAPAANCGEVVGHIPDGLQVVKIENLAEAREAVAVIGSGGDTSGLPACTSN